MFNKVLIANRGEIACRVIGTCNKLGVKTVAVYSDADREALHVKLADEAVYIGESPATESYLDYKKIIDAAKKTGADAIHPGYGFLSENQAFADACKKEKLVFIGPPVGAIDAMGDKAKAKAIMEKAKVPTVPGAYGAKLTPTQLQKAAKEIGYPVLLKAVAGGGGKGMRLVENDKNFADAFAAASREGQSSFGNGEVMVEKYLAKTRHVEVQIFADSKGNCVYLFDRDCSLQRRHQKVVEEAPAPNIAPELREKMGVAAVRAAQAVGYVGAGTVEFLLDGDNFYFMEMNTRLQVEHPVTEAILNIDLVELQLLIAFGEELMWCQDELNIDGHAIEVRLYAEDPNQNFMPSTGLLLHCELPEESENIRVDRGVITGDTISHYYDPMIAKIITWGETRSEALRHMQLALQQTRIVGVTTNIDYLKRIIANPTFVDGKMHTKLLEEEQESLLKVDVVSAEILALAALYQVEKRALVATDNNDPYSPWQDTSRWRLGGDEPETFVFEEGTVTIVSDANGWIVDSMHASVGLYGDVLNVQLENKAIEATVIEEDKTLHIFTPEGHFKCTIKSFVDMAEDEDIVFGKLSAPLPGKIVRVPVKVGAKVVKGADLVILEAMKTEHHITAPADGVVDSIHFAEGQNVDKDAILVDFTPKVAS